jgi:hypothetical protein
MPQELPASIEPEHLAERTGGVQPSIFGRVFADTATSYKLFWLCGLLECLKRKWAENAAADNTRTTILGRDIVREMIVAAWAPVCLFRLSLGQRDQLSTTCRRIQNNLRLRENENPARLRRALSDANANELGLDLLLDFVPALFQSPWFLHELTGFTGGRERAKRARELADEFKAAPFPPPYYLSGAEASLSISLHPAWESFFKENLGILEGFLEHHLCA